MEEDVASTNCKKKKNSSGGNLVIEDYFRIFLQKLIERQ
jgi:hypothetical protein